MWFACQISKKRVQVHTVFSTCCFSTAITVTETCPSVVLYVCSLSCFWMWDAGLNPEICPEYIKPLWETNRISLQVKQIKARPTRCNKWWFIVNQLFLNMFRASLRPSSGEQTVCGFLSWLWLWLRRVATRLFGATTIARTGNHRQWYAVCSPDDGRKDPQNMLRNNWLPINHHLLHLVGLAFIWLYEMHGQSSLIFKCMTSAILKDPQTSNREVYLQLII